MVVIYGKGQPRMDDFQRFALVRGGIATGVSDFVGEQVVGAELIVARIDGGKE